MNSVPGFPLHGVRETGRLCRIDLAVHGLEGDRRSKAHASSHTA
jgi:hypothetical protein